MPEERLTYLAILWIKIILWNCCHVKRQLIQPKGIKKKVLQRCSRKFIKRTLLIFWILWSLCYCRLWRFVICCVFYYILNIHFLTKFHIHNFVFFSLKKLISPNCISSRTQKPGSICLHNNYQYNSSWMKSKKKKKPKTHYYLRVSKYLDNLLNFLKISTQNDYRTK